MHGASVHRPLLRTGGAHTRMAPAMATTPPAIPLGGASDTAGPPGPAHGPALAVLAAVFFMWGFVTVLNDILVPHLKGIFALSYAQSMLIQFTFFSAYFLVALPAARLTARIGYQRSIVAGLLVMAVGALLFVPAARTGSYGTFLGGLYVLASGMTLLQVSANPYVTVLGPPAGASSRLNLVQALNSLGTTVGPFVGGLLILSPADGAGADASSVVGPYLGIAALLVVLAVVIASFRFPTVSGDAAAGTINAGPRSLWHARHLVLGAVGIFTYVGAEVAIGSFLVSYFVQATAGALTAQAAAGYVSFYWGGAMVGRFVGSAVLQRLGTGRVVGAAAVAAGALVCTSMLSTGAVAMWSIILVGLCNSIMFPSIFTLGIAGLGPLTSRGSGVLVAAIVGGALMPLAQGVMADTAGLQPSFVVPAACYLYVVYYGFVGSKPRFT